MTNVKQDNKGRTIKVSKEKKTPCGSASEAKAERVRPVSMRGKNKEPTIKQQRVVEELVSGNVSTKKEALINAGYSENMAYKPSVVLKSTGVQSLIEAAERQGMTDDWCVDKIKNAIEALSDQGRNYYVIDGVVKYLRVKYLTDKPDVTNNFATLIQNVTPEQEYQEAIKVIAQKYATTPETVETVLKGISTPPKQ